MSTNKLRRDLADLTRTVGDAKACRDCRGVQYMGAPGLFVSLWIPRKHGDPRGPGTHRRGTDEEFARYFDGCPTCGEQVKTVPIIMPRLAVGGGGGHGRPEVPDPWPINEWPPILVKKTRYWGAQ